LEYEQAQELKEPGLDLSVLTARQSPPHPAIIRTPPTFGNGTDTTWTPIPDRWMLGTWFFTRSNSLNYQSWRNMQWTLSPQEPNSYNDTLTDLVSWQVANSSQIFLSYGIDTPSIVGGIKQHNSYHWVPPPPMNIVNNTWEVISWGYDAVSVPYVVLYETPGVGQNQSAFDIISRSDKGVTPKTMHAINDGLVTLGNQELITLAGQAKPLRQDGARDGSLYPICNATCQSNGELP
jgi:hypothetical protein